MKIKSRNNYGKTNIKCRNLGRYVCRTIKLHFRVFIFSPYMETDSEGNAIPERTEEKQDQFIDIVDTVESIMHKYLKKED